MSFILLLRSFEHEDLLGWPAGGNAVYSLEELLVEALSAIAPVHAIGRPDDNYPPGGAIRKYVPNAEWQSTVRRLLDECTAVAFVAGATPGALWEFSLITQSMNPERVLTVVLPEQTEKKEGVVEELLVEGAYERFRAEARKTVSVALPQVPRGSVSFIAG